MKRILTALITLLILFVLASSAAGGDIPLSVVPENTQWLIHFDMSGFSKTRIGQRIMDKKLNDLSRHQKATLEKLNFDVTKDLESITVFGEREREDDMTVCVRGKFDKAHLLTLLGIADNHRETSYGSRMIHSWDDDEHGAFVSDQLVVYSKSERNVKRVLDAADGKVQNLNKSKQMMSQFRDIPKDAFLKVVAHKIGHLADEGEHSLILKKAGRLVFMAYETNRELKMKLKLETDNGETAKNIKQIADGFIALLQMSNGERQQKLKQHLNQLKINVNGNIIDVELVVPENEIDKVMKDTLGLKHK